MNTTPEAHADREQLDADVHQPGRDRLGARTSLDEQHDAGAAHEDIGGTQRRPPEELEGRAGHPDAGSQAERDHHRGTDDAGEHQVDDVAGPVRGKVVVADAPPIAGEGHHCLHHGGRGQPRRRRPVPVRAQRWSGPGPRRPARRSRPASGCGDDRTGQSHASTSHRKTIQADEAEVADHADLKTGDVLQDPRPGRQRKAHQPHRPHRPDRQASRGPPGNDMFSNHP